MESDCFPLGHLPFTPAPPPVCTRHFFLSAEVMDASCKEALAELEEDAG